MGTVARTIAPVAGRTPLSRPWSLSSPGPAGSRAWSSGSARDGKPKLLTVDEFGSLPFEPAAPGRLPPKPAPRQTRNRMRD